MVDTPAAVTLQRLVESTARKYRYTMILAAYDPVSRMATLTTVVSGTATRELPVSRSLMVMPSALAAGTRVVVERMDGRTPIVVDVFDRPVDAAPPTLAGGYIDAGSTLAPQINFRPHDPTQAAVAWDIGLIGLAGNVYTIDSGNTEGRYIVWGPPSNQLFAVSNVPLSTQGLYVLAVNEGGVPIAAFGGIPGQAIFSGTVTSGAIATGGIAGYNIANQAVGTQQIAALAVTSGQLAPLSVSSGTLIDGSVVTRVLADTAVTEPKLADNAISTRTIISGAVTNPKIAADAIQTVNILDAAVTGAKIAATTITDANISASAAIALTKLSGSPTLHDIFVRTASDALGNDPAWTEIRYVGTL